MCAPPACASGGGEGDDSAGEGANSLGLERADYRVELVRQLEAGLLDARIFFGKVLTAGSLTGSAAACAALSIAKRSAPMLSLSRTSSSLPRARQGRDRAGRRIGEAGRVCGRIPGVCQCAVEEAVAGAC